MVALKNLCGLPTCNPVAGNEKFDWDHLASLHHAPGSSLPVRRSID